MGWSWNPIDDVEQVAHDVKEGVENTAHAAGDVIGGVAHAARDEIGGVARGAGDVVGGVAQGISDEVGGLVDGAGDLLSGHPLDAVEDVAGGVMRGAGDVVGGVARGVGDVVEGVAHGISDEIGGLVHGVEDLFGGDDQSVAEKEAGDVKKEQAGLRKMLADDGDFSTSDEILDAGTVGLRFFADFIPVYKQAAQYVDDAKNVNIDLSADIYHNYDETRGIDMGRFRGDAEHIDTAVKQIGTSQQNLSSSFCGLSDWTGSGADAARRYNDSLLGAMAGFVTGKSESGDGSPDLGQAFAAGAQSAPQVITTAMSNIQTALKGQAQNIGGMYSTRCGGQTVEQVRDNIRKASGDLNIGDIGGGDILSGIGESVKDAFLGGLLGGGIGGLIGGLIGAEESGEKIRENIINQAKQKLQDFVAEFDSKKIAFDQHIHTVQQAISQDYNTMLDGLKSLQQDPTKGIADPPSFEATAHRSSRSGSGDHRSGNGGDTGGGGNSGGSGGGTVPMGGGTTLPSGSTTPPAAAPSVSAPTGNNGHPETVTIHDGDSTIQLSSSDSRGRVKLTVDNGTGKPKTYDIDFGEGTGGVGGLGLSGPAGTRGAASESKGIDSTESVDANGVRHVHAGPDGTATIHDGKETITVRQPDGDSGDMKLTVDDGTGKPKTYDVDFTAAAHSIPASSASSLGAGPEASLSGTGTAGASGGGGAGGLAGAASAGAGSTQLGDGGMTGASDAAVHQGAPAGPAAAPAPADGRNSASGMPMMGGMAGMGAGSGAGGDTERGSNPLLRGSGKVFKPDPEAERAAKIRRVLEGGN